MTSTPEQTIGRFTKWYRRTPVSLEFWDGVLTDQRLIWCFVGESFHSLLLRADTGASTRETIADLSPDAVAALDDRNIVIPLENLHALRLTTGSLIRRPSLLIEWDEDTTRTLELEGMRTGGPQTAFVESLAGDDRFSHATITVEHPRFGL